LKIGRLVAPVLRNVHISFGFLMLFRSRVMRPNGTDGQTGKISNAAYRLLER